jgi:hypothetical protein
MPRFCEHAACCGPRTPGDEKPETAVRKFPVYYTEFAPARVLALPDAQALKSEARASAKTRLGSKPSTTCTRDSPFFS